MKKTEGTAIAIIHKNLRVFNERNSGEAFDETFVQIQDESCVS